jgi:hypothetical protein
MLGLIAKASEMPIAEEFFQLFKTPWEPFDPDHSYNVVLTTGEIPTNCNCKLLVHYASEAIALHAQMGVSFRRRLRNRVVVLNSSELPIYGEIATVPFGKGTIGSIPDDAQSPGFIARKNQRTEIRIGYDLFAEVDILLARGQDHDHAGYATLDLHIDVLRRLILDAGLPIIEIPPAPAGTRFVSCLTHDIDFVSLRQHRFDRAMLGFFYRATVSTVLDFVRGRCGLRKVVKNAGAVLRWPLVQLGLCEDFWLPFGRYLEVEQGRPSTFFLIPFKNQCGQALDGRDSKRRAVRYDVEDVQEWLPILRERGCEAAVHGLDAWNDSSKGRQELDRIGSRTGEGNPGVRMHWLYFSEESPREIEAAGFGYDSTCGYNDAVGFRAGTSQVFRPPGTCELLELPLHVQDTAMFFPGRMHSTESEAWALFKGVLEHCRRHGGVLTVLWHDRSLVPERLWDQFYLAVLKELSSAQTWFATAGDVVEWFRSRREVRFGDVSRTDDGFEVTLDHVPVGAKQDLVLRVTVGGGGPDGGATSIDSPIKGRNRMRITLPESSHCAEVIAGHVNA